MSGNFSIQMMKEDLEAKINVLVALIEKLCDDIAVASKRIADTETGIFKASQT